jgi:hypothetical protein
LADGRAEVSYNIEELFSFGRNPRLRVIIFGYDAFSGSRKVFISKDYTLSDIADGKYEVLGLAIANLLPERIAPDLSTPIKTD